jgi:hypothetical protein
MWVLVIVLVGLEAVPPGLLTAITPLTEENVGNRVLGSGRRHMDQNSTLRRIYFYRAVCLGKDGNKVTFDPAALLAVASKLPSSVDGRSMKMSDKTRLTIHVDSSTPPILRLRFGRTRLQDIPYEETGEYDLRDLAVDPAGGISEVIHVAFYPNGIVGHVYHHPGPTMSQLAAFFESRCPEVIPLRLDFLPLMHPNALTAILKYDKFRSVTFTIDGGAADLIDNARASRPLLLAAKDIHQVGRPVTIQMTVRRIKDEDSIKQVIVDIANNPSLAGAIRQVKVNGTEYETVHGKKKKKAHNSAIDLIAQDLIFEEPIVAYGKNKRTLDDASAYAKMDEVYGKSRDTLEAAAHIE